MTMLKSIGAILAGFVVGGGLSVATDTVLEALHVFPPLSEGFFITWMVTLALVYRSIYNVIGCYVTAALAPNKPMLHVMIIGVVGFILTIIGTIVNADKGPLWYGITLAVLALPSAWLGATLQMRTKNLTPASGA